MKLESMPGSLHEVYAQKMDNINSLPDQESRMAKKALAWVLLAQRPLDAEELPTALAIRTSATEVHPDDIPDIIQITALCNGLLVYSEERSTWLLAHHSAGMFLRNTRAEWEPEAEFMVARDCLTYLAFAEFSKGHCATDDEFNARLIDNPFYKYVARHWSHHVRESPLLPIEAARSFLMDKAKVASASQAMLYSEQHVFHPGDSELRQTGLHLAAFFGLDKAVDLLLSEGMLPSAKDSTGRTPLWLAIEAGHKSVVRLLSYRDRTSFMLMLEQGHKLLAFSLIQVAGQHVKDFRLRTALHIGVIRQDLDLMRCAIENGADIDAQDDDGWTPLRLAVFKKTVTAIDLLLDNSASTAGVFARNWRRAYDTDDVLELLQNKHGPQQVKIHEASSFSMYLSTHPLRNQRLLYVVI
jgi:ankyrin repeat protein